MRNTYIRKNGNAIVTSAASDTASIEGRQSRLIAAALAMLFTGVIYAWSVFKVPLAAEFSWSVSALAFNYTLTLCFFCIGGILGGFLIQKRSARTSLLIAAGSIFAGFFITSRLSGNIVMLYFCYGILSSTGIGMAYNAIITTMNAWFPDRKGFCTGVLMMCFGLSALLMGSAAERLFNMPGFGWRKTFLLFGVLTAVVLLGASYWMQKPDTGVMFPEGKKSSRRGAEVFETRDYSTGEMLRRSSFWRFFAFMALSSTVGSTTISFARDIAASAGAAAAFATALAGTLSLCNGLGRIVCGSLLDRLGRRRTMLLVSGLVITSAAVLLVAVNLRSLPLCVAALCLTGMGYGALAPLVAVFTTIFYGQKYFSGNYGMANTMMIPSSFSASLAGILLSSTGSYAAPVMMILVFAALGLLFNWSLKRP